MLVKPKLNYRLYATHISVSKDKTYKATIATSQPNYKERGAVFVGGILLEKGEYTIVKK